ncbi:MAG: nucleotidyltransferase family protein [bacterium]|nr:nucleotidyltransferase family protein [bacterium]
MEFCAIICEFNPLTNGHAYFIEKSKEKSGLPLVAIMSGNFTQRGTPAVLDKFSRAEIAVKLGCFAVLELPTCFAVSPAQNFAYGAISCVKSLNNITNIAFGAEWDNLDDLITIAKFELNPANEFNQALKSELKLGKNYNAVYSNLLEKFLPNIKVSEILSGANNILAIEYIKAIIKLKLNLKINLIKRNDNGFNSNVEAGKFLGATGVRERLTSSEDISAFVPKQTLEALNKFTFDYSGFHNLERLNLATSEPKKLSNLFDYCENIEYKLNSLALNKTNINEVINGCGKRYRTAKITRLALYSVLNLTKTKHAKISSGKTCMKLLAIKKEDKSKIKELISKNSKIVITSKDYTKPNESLNFDLSSSKIYYSFSNLPISYDLTHGTSFVD